MWKVVRILLFIAYIGYAFSFVDDQAREEGFLASFLALVVAAFFGYCIYRVFWIWKPDEDNENKK